MPHFNQMQDRHSVLDPASIPYQSFYIADPPAAPDALLYQLNRAGALQRFPSRFLIRRDEEYPFSALLCITEGKGNVTIEGKRIPFEAGQIMLLPPYTAYEYRSDPQDPFSIIWAEFCGGDSQRFSRHIMTYNGPLFPAGLPSVLTDICVGLTHPPQANRMTWISNKLYEAMLILCDACSRLAPKPQEDIYQIMDYIDQHLGEGLTLSGLSVEFGYSPAYFSRFFLRHTGVHFSQYLLRRRVERGRQLLLSTDLPIDQLAHRLGFCDSSHFVRKFREVVGESPARYRRAHLD